MDDRSFSQEEDWWTERVVADADQVSYDVWWVASGRAKGPNGLLRSPF